jgi:mutator protein MutT
MELRMNANAIITNDNGKILILKLKKGPFKGKLSIPGGGIEPGETSKDAIKREIFEETGLNISNNITPLGFCELINHKIKSHRIVALLHSKTNGIPITTAEGKAEWMDIEEVKKLENDIVPFTLEAIKIWEKDSTHFELITR